MEDSSNFCDKCGQQSKTEEGGPVEQLAQRPRDGGPGGHVPLAPEDVHGVPRQARPRHGPGAGGVHR